jgi:Uma2 family endonuclease
MTASAIKMTAGQYLQLGEDPVGVRLELVDGEVAVSPSPVPDHSHAIIMLCRLLGDFVEEHDLGQLHIDTDTIFGEYDVRRPDLAFYRKSRLHVVGEAAIHSPPDLAIEVLSPSSIQTDRKDKFKLYAAGKVKDYWIVDPKAKTIEAYHLTRGKFVGRVRGSGSDIVQLPPFEKLKIPLAKLWRPRA